jgi:hypothetical protein
MNHVRKSIGLFSLLLALTLTVGVQQPAAAAKPAKVAQAEPAASTVLPVTRVSLYKNGVGFFEHAGRVTGDQTVTIDFTTAQLNDVLQSLTAVDLNGGRIAGAGYNSTTPLDQQLKALPLALVEDPTAGDFYAAIRGSRVEVHGPGVTISGRLLNIELLNSTEGDKPTPEKRLITVIGDAGEVRSVELTPATEVRLLDADLRKDLTRYLELLASTHNQGLRHLTIQDNGTGARELRVSYISEVPIWKSTYRILFTEPKSTDAAAKQTATLQGWSVVDNTTGVDWINVKLSLIAGAPDSFIQPLSVPYYSRRPQIGLPQEAQLTPQTHESGEAVTVTNAPVPTVTNAPPPLGVVARMGSGSGAGYGSGSAGGVAGGLMAKSRATTVGASGIYGGTGQTGLNENYVEGVPVSNIGGTSPYDSYSELAEKSVTAKSSTAAFDDYFAYTLTEPITIRKNESAMVPILQTKIDAERVTLWSQRQPTPLRALWITNTSDLTLDRGSFSIVEDGNFGGEGLLDPIHPAEKRLLSYAVDQAVHVSLDPQSNTSRATSISVAKGVVVLRNTQVAKTTYVVRNAADEARTVVVEQPIRSGYTLDSDVTPAEKTSTVYRFRVETKSNETERLTVTETKPGETRYQLSDSNDNQLKLIFDQIGHDSTFEAALAPILDARRHVAELQNSLDKVNNRLVELQSDEQRQRENVAALAKIDVASRERFVRDLNKTEDQIISAHKELNAAMKAVDAAKDDLADKIQSLQIDEKI